MVNIWSKHSSKVPWYVRLFQVTSQANGVGDLLSGVDMTYLLSCNLFFVIWANNYNNSLTPRIHHANLGVFFCGWNLILICFGKSGEIGEILFPTVQVCPSRHAPGLPCRIMAINGSNGLASLGSTVMPGNVAGSKMAPDWRGISYWKWGHSSQLC